MKPLCIALLAATMLFGCRTKYVQVFETAPYPDNRMRAVDGDYVYENDSMRVTYAFWGIDGVMAMTIENKSDHDLYVDWGRSACIMNKTQLSYWVDEMHKDKVSYYRNYVYTGPTVIPGKAKGEVSGVPIRTKTMKDVRLSKIPAKQSLAESAFYLFPIEHYNEIDNPNLTVKKSSDGKGKKVDVWEKTYNMDSSPLMFRNYMVLSYHDDLTEHFVVDNGFYVSKFTETTQGDFHGKPKKKTINNFDYEMTYYKPVAFYKYVPKRLSLDDLKHKNPEKAQEGRQQAAK